MTKFLNLEKWNRREVFEFFLGFDKPYFNISTQLDVTQLLTTLPERAVNPHPARLASDRVGHAAFTLRP